MKICDDTPSISLTSLQPSSRSLTSESGKSVAAGSIANNRLVLIRRDGYDKNNNPYGIFQCSCGKETRARLSDVRCGNTKSCGCYNMEVRRSRKGSRTPCVRDSLLTYVGEAEYRSMRVTFAVYRCSCGKEKTLRVWDVRRGHTKSCGCSTGKMISGALKGKPRPRPKDRSVVTVPTKRASRPREKLLYELRAASSYVGQGCGNYGMFVRNEKARIEMSGRSTRIVTGAGGKIGLWVSS